MVFFCDCKLLKMQILKRPKELENLKPHGHTTTMGQKLLWKALNLLISNKCIILVVNKNPEIQIL